MTSTFKVLKPKERLPLPRVGSNYEALAEWSNTDNGGGDTGSVGESNP